MYDPIVAEVRKYRDEHARKFNYDLDAICADLVAKQEKRGRMIRRRDKSSTIGSTQPRKLGT
ncbi:MAG: hypothetical protein LAT79_16510 [Kiritimatiellae bacterium]|nr:hypothetical protein [Kiritimatiellia bacterium]